MHELSQEIARSEPEVPFDLDEDFLICLRTSRRGAAEGPSGMMSEHFFLLLDNERDSRVATFLARGGPHSGIGGCPIGAIDSSEEATEE